MAHLSGGGGGFRAADGSVDMNSSGYMASINAPDTGIGSWFKRLLDPNGYNAEFNQYQAGLDRNFNAYQAGLERDWNASQAELERNFNASEAEKARNFSAEQAKIQREYEERMSSTAYSRAIADLRSNGINPYILGQGASQASTPAGASGSAYQASSGSARSGSARSGSGARLSGSSGLIGQLASAAYTLGKFLL